MPPRRVRRESLRVPSKYAITSMPVAEALDRIERDPQYMTCWLCESKDDAQKLHRTVGVSARARGLTLTGVIGPTLMADELYWMLFVRRNNDE